MIYLFAIIITLLPIGIYITDVLNIRTKMVNNVFIPIVAIQLLLSPTIVSKIINYNIYAILLYLVLSLIFVYLLIYIIRNFRKITFNKKLFIRCLGYILIIIISTTIIIFTFYTSNNSNNDLNYYINISKNFQNNFFATNGIIISNNEILSETSMQYLFPQMYYSFSVLFKNHLSLAYFLINPLFYTALIIISVDDFLKRFSINNIFVILSIQLSMMLISVSSLYLNVPAGNLGLQSLVVILMLNNIDRNCKADISSLFPFIGLSFFSSTGIVTALTASFVVFLYNLIIKKNCLNFFFIMPVISIALYNFILLKGDDFSKITNILLSYLCSILFITFYASRFNFFSKYKIGKRKLYVDKIIFSSVIVLVLLITFLSFFSNIFFIKSISPNTSHFNDNLSYCYLIMALSLTTILIKKYIDKKEIDWIIISLFFSSLMSTSERLIISTFTNNHSIWRLIYLNIGMGNIPDIVIQLLILIYYGFNVFNIKNILKSKKIKKFFMYFNIFIVSMGGIWTMASTYTNIFNSKNQSFKSSVYKNLNVCTKKDIDLIKSIDFGNYEKTYITDIMINQYINKGIDITSYMNYQQGKKIVESYHWNYKNFLNGIEYWNEENNEKLDINSDSVIMSFKNLLSSFSQTNIKKINGERISKLDYILISKNTSYFNELEREILNNNFVRFKNGENIIIYIGV